MNVMEKMFVKRNVFNLTHDKKFDCSMGQLIPILCEEVLPGDSWKVFTDMLVRFAPMVGPMMHEVNVFTRYFFVPTRIIWNEWEKFITGGPQGTDTPIHPYIAAAVWTKYSLGDYLGLPVGPAENCSALPFRAIAKIRGDWFINQTFQTPPALSTNSGADSTTDITLANVNWEKDYFTCSLPFTQRGNPVSIPLGTSAPVVIPGSTSTPANDQLAINNYTAGGAYMTYSYESGTGYTKTATGETSGATELRGQSTSDRSLVGTADLSTATAATVNQMRLAFQIQRLLEKLARAGGRYVEYNMAMFGVRSSDARLQRSEYLGGGESRVVVSEVLQTSQTETTPQGTMAGHGFSAHRSHEFKKSFEEHGFIIGLMYVLPKTSYQQGLPRTFSRTTRYDYFVPLFSHLGEQAVLKKEVYADQTDGHDDEVWGYQGGWDELRRRENTVHGDFRNDTGLGTWACTRIFATRPSLGSAFVTADPSTRPFAVTNKPTVICYLKNNVRAIRPLPKIAEPGYMDH